VVAVAVSLMTQRDESDGLAGWLALLALTAYWAWMYWWTKRLVRELVALGHWLRREPES
jgi:hypothetical protein